MLRSGWCLRRRDEAIAKLLEFVGCVDRAVGLEGVVVGPGGHVLADAVVVYDACDF